MSTRPEHASLRLERPLQLYLRASMPDHPEDGPRWVCLELTQARLDQLSRLRALAQLEGLQELILEGTPVWSWEVHARELSGQITHRQLHVSPEAFWYSAQVDYWGGGARASTHRVYFAELLQVITQGDGVYEYAWRQGDIVLVAPARIPALYLLRQEGEVLPGFP